MKKKSVGFIIFTAITLLAAQLHADTFYTTNNQTAGSTPNWNSAIWTNALNTAGASPIAGNDYVLSSAATATLRSPYGVTGVQAFNGDSLQLNSGGAIRLKRFGTTVATTYTFGTGGLKLNSGYVGNGDDQVATIN